MPLRTLLTCLALLVAAPLHASDWTWTYQDDARLVADAFAADGTAYVVGNRASGTTHVVTRVAPDGTVVWTREHAGVWTEGVDDLRQEQDAPLAPITKLDVGSDRLCLFGGDVTPQTVTQAVYAACYRLADGELLQRFAFDRLRFRGGFSPSQLYALLLPDGGFVAVTITGNSSTRQVRHRRFAASGAVLHDIFLDSGASPEIDGRRSDGAVLILSYAPIPEYRVLDADGVVRFRLDANLLRPTAQFAPDGTIWMAGQIGTTGREFEWRHFEADGRELARAPIDGCTPCGGTILSFFPRFVFDGDTVFLEEMFNVSTDSVPGTCGSCWFTSRLTAPAFRIPRPSAIRVDPATGAPLAFSGYGYKCGVYSLDSAGAVLHTRILAACPGARLRVTSDGTLRLIGGDAGGLRVHALANAYAPRAVTRLDQPGLRGAWYATYAPNQGFVVEYLPATRTLFVPWFTYGTHPDDFRTRVQRWFSLQGEVPANATRATLDIFESRGGVLGGPPLPTPRRVGSATLEAHDCDSMTLEFSLESSFGGARQAIPLSRLTPATEPCVLADGSVRGTQPPPRDGFDARQSGAWFTPGLPGQGLTFTVHPGGTFFGAWFTHDPVPLQFEPTQQQWFSLQGDLGTATNGRVTVPIFRTTGGQLVDYPSTTTTVVVGTATITFTACDRATLDYAFDGQFGSRTGTLALEKIGGCDP